MTVEIVALAADSAGHTSTAEAVTFWVVGAVALLGAVGVVAAPKAVYSAIFLAVTMISLAVLYIAQEALFLGIVQVVVYTGAVMMLFLFVLMLIGVDSVGSPGGNHSRTTLCGAVRGRRVRRAADRRHRQRFGRRASPGWPRPTAAATSKASPR